MHAQFAAERTAEYDTAIAYQNGTSEQYVGRALWDFAKREDVVVATKFLPRIPEEIEQGISDQQHIENMIDMSLKNLGIVVYASVDSSASITSL